MTDKSIGLFGEVLFDCFPDGQQVLGGAPFNVAWHLHAFGQCPCFISRIGDDALGGTIRDAMLAWGMAVDDLQVDTGNPTGVVEIRISNSEPAYEILPNQAYDFIDAGQLDQGKQYGILYHGTLALRNGHSEQALNALTARHNGKVFVDVNLREPWWRKEQVSQYLGQADWVKLNHDELAILQPSANDLPEAMRWFRTQYDLEALIVTCGSQGAMAINDAGELIEVKPERNLAIVDTVGAGDAFSAVVLLGLQSGWPLPVTMERAQAFASVLVTRRGATVQDLSFYKAFIDAWNLG